MCKISRLPSLPGRAVENDPAMRKRHDAVGIAPGKFELMQAHDGADAVGLANPMQQPEHAVGTRRVEARDRLVGENEGRLLDEGARNADALLLAAGQLIGAAQRIVDQADALDGIQSEPFLVCLRMAAGCESSNGSRDVPSGRW